MTLLFIDGFDHYATADLTKKWTSAGVNAAIVAGAGRRGSAGLRCTGGSPSVSKTLAAASASFVVAFSFTMSAIPSIIDIVRLLDAGTTQCGLKINGDGTLSVTRNGTAVTGGTSTFALSTGQTYYIEWKVTIADSIAANSCKVRVNGSDVITVAAGQDLKNTANASANQVALAAGGSLSSTICDFDDFYICDQNGSVNNDFLGDVRVDALYPTSDGANQAWTPSTGTTHYTLVDETAPNTTDYVESGTAAQKDTYGMGDISHTPVNIFGAQVSIAALKDDAGARSIKPVTRSGGTDYSGASQALATGQLYYTEVRETDPATSAAWTKTGINAAEFGVECV